MRDRFALLASACVLSMAVGCGKSSEPVAKSAEASKPPTTEEARPSTQALLTGKTKRLPLPGMPLILTVPESWKLDTDGPVSFVLGPTLYGTVNIGLSSPGTVAFKQQEIDALVGKLSAETASHPEHFRRETHRNLGNVQLIEKRYLKKPLTRDKHDAKGDPIPDGRGGFETVTTTPVHWTLTAFVPGEQDFARYELNVIDLDTDQIAVDEPLLDKVMASITVQGAGPTTAATTTP